MKKLSKILYMNVALLILVGLLAGCGDNKNDSTSNSSEDSSAQESSDENTTETDESSSSSEEEKSDSTTEESENQDTESSSSENNTEENKDALSQYSSQEIEYARVWLQLGPNQELDELNVHHIPAGTPLNPDDETSLTYPEDVIQLAGSRLVDGSVTYSGNGDGTINVYKVPLRWDGQYPAGEEFYQELIDNTELVAIDTGDEEQVIKLIKLLNIQ
ncbi:hypothetical protein [Paucisalibacillus sp. EB02]|uniref:hypothetical protein n=1 Tax=Paucisalibacillus sp. EB02 TaxID=1347087 RepID=UPI0005A6303E|nr:hypothetical protein [Paucisalibacillus sp. EB02]